VLPDGKSNLTIEANCRHPRNRGQLEQHRAGRFPLALIIRRSYRPVKLSAAIDMRHGRIKALGLVSRQKVRKLVRALGSGCGFGLPKIPTAGG